VSGGEARRPTIRDVAREAGVSRGTVSRVLNGGAYVSPSALALVNAAIERTGYIVNNHARSLATGRSNAIAFLLTEPTHLLFEDPNFSTLLSGAAQALSERDLPLVLMLASTPAQRRRTLAYLTNRHVDGVLVVSSHAGDPLLAGVVRAGLPVVACGRPLGQPGLGYVAADDHGGARRMTEHLLARGRRRVAMISGPLDTSGGVDRLAGHREALVAALGEDAWDERLVVHGEYSRAGGRTAMERLLAQAPELDAVFVASDLMAAGALEALRAAGRSVPGDVAVGGFDDSSVAATLDPPLTTVRNPLPRISEEMVRVLLDVVDGKDPVSIVVPTKLVPRSST
jgi:DNA-binding LacI/PurR family transcriptional regulator